MERKKEMEEEVMEAARACVARGSAYFTEKYGDGWRKRITRPVDPSSNENCPLAQVSGMLYGPASRYLVVDGLNPANLGFTIASKQYCSGYERQTQTLTWKFLQSEWEKEVSK
jgi:hypothetical protein